MVAPCSWSAIRCSRSTVSARLSVITSYSIHYTKLYDGLAETVDRLHRVADQKQRAPVPGDPSGDQLLEQGELAVGGILELVHQNVTDAAVELQQQLLGSLAFAQRYAGAGGDRDKVDTRITSYNVCYTKLLRP